MREIDVLVQSYESGYEDLVRDLSRICDEALDWKITPQAITIGSSVLHVLGYELMLVAALEGNDVTQIRTRVDWPQYECGFQKELGAPTPRGLPLAHYLSLIGARRKNTRRFWEESAPKLLDGSTWFYRDGQEFKESGLCLEKNEALMTSILCHVRYHRGQITLLKYLFSVNAKLDYVRS